MFVAPSDEHLEIGLVAIERSFAILTNAAIDNIQIRLDAQVQLGNAVHKRRDFLKRLGFIKPGISLKAAEAAFQASIKSYNQSN